MNNAVIAGLTGVAVFALLWLWAPLDGLNTKRSVSERGKSKKSAQVEYDFKGAGPFASSKSEIEAILEDFKNETDQQNIEKICESAVKLDVNSNAYKQSRRKALVGKTRIEREQLESTLDAFHAFTDDKCENGKVKSSIK